jgi:glycosyltransferase involved in cell wall biosynthesis
MQNLLKERTRDFRVRQFMKSRKPIRVLLTVPHLNCAAAPYRDMLAIAKHLPREEFDLTICSTGQKGHQETEKILKELGRRCLFARFRPSASSVREVLSSFQAQAQIDKYGPFDIQHSIMGTSSPYEAFLSRIKSRIHVHSQIDMTDGGKPFNFRLKLRLAKKIITVSESVRKFILAHGISPTKVKTIYNGLDLDEIHANLERNGSIQQILSVGLIVRRKRHQDAIKSFALITKEFPEAQLRIVGRVIDRHYYEELQKLVRVLGLSSKVEFMGVRKDVLDVMQQSTALMHCADSEGLPWVILESMAVGLPVIGSSIEPIQEMLEQNKTGLVVPLGDLEGYANALKSILVKPDFAQQLAKNARGAAEKKFSDRAMVNQIADVYRELVS